MPLERRLLYRNYGNTLLYPQTLASTEQGDSQSAPPQIARAAPSKNCCPTCHYAAMQRRRGRRDKPLILYKTIRGCDFCDFRRISTWQKCCTCEGEIKVMARRLLSDTLPRRRNVRTALGTVNRLSPCPGHVSTATPAALRNGCPQLCGCPARSAFAHPMKKAGRRHWRW